MAHSDSQHGQRIALGIEYDGSRFHGWQRQPVRPSVQGTLERALSRVADGPIRLTTAGRTDTGVHATGQVAAFTSHARRPLHGWLRGTNSLTPDSITVQWVREVDGGFHARFSATGRRYLYLILEGLTPPAIGRHLLCWSRHRLDVPAMDQAARHLLGEQDFTSLRAAACQSHTPFRHVYQAQLCRRGDLIVLDIRANAFLHHMVRNIAGVLMQIGRGERPPDWMAELLAARRRALAAPTAPAAGLYLAGVRYPPPYAFPAPRPPLMLRGLPDV